jgi:hypothetical protein
MIVSLIARTGLPIAERFHILAAKAVVVLQGVFLVVFSFTSILMPEGSQV